MIKFIIPALMLICTPAAAETWAIYIGITDSGKEITFTKSHLNQENCKEATSSVDQEQVLYDWMFDANLKMVRVVCADVDFSYEMFSTVVRD